MDLTKSSTCCFILYHSLLHHDLLLLVKLKWTCRCEILKKSNFWWVNEVHAIKIFFPRRECYFSCCICTIVVLFIYHYSIKKHIDTSLICKCCLTFSKIWSNGNAYCRFQWTLRLCSPLCLLGLWSERYYKVIFTVMFTFCRQNLL